MTPFRDLPIRRKVAAVIVLTSTIVVLLTAAAFLTYEWMTFRQTALANLTTLSRIVADNSTAALRFHNEADLQELLGTLRAEPDIERAGIFDAAKQPVAFYSLEGAQRPTIEEVLAVPGHRFADGALLLSLPIIHNGRPLGTLFIESSLAAMHRRFLLYGGIVLLILITSSLVAFAFSSRFQRRITDPIQELAKTAHAIAAKSDHSVRALRYGNDELGALTDSFNHMLDEINERGQRLSASEERLRVALAAAEMGTWRYYPENGVSILDDNFCRIYGMPPANGTTPADEVIARVFPDDRVPVQAALQRALQGTDAQFFMEYRVLDQNGDVRWVRNRGRVIPRTDGAIEYVTGALVDITDRKLAEQEVQRLNTDLERRVAERTAELEQANRELEAFTYSVSHDLRGPLRHMSGYAEIVRDDEATQLSADARDCLKRIEHGADRLMRMVDSLLNLSRVGRRSLVVEKTKLDDLVTTAIRELDAESKERKIEWKRHPLPVAKVDAELLQLVFVNLLNNALKYTRPRAVAVIEIGTEVRDGRIVIFIRDNGVGFDPKYKDKLFGVFERLHSGTAFEGNGIGLATVDRIIRKHGGRIQGEGALDQGATFYFTLAGV